MTVIKPFRGITYNRELIKDLGQVITPPYDVIGPGKQEQLYCKNPYNVIRLEYGKTYPQDTRTDNRYSRAAETLNSWLEQGVLRPDPGKNYYFHEHSFHWQDQTLTRFGFMAALKLEPYGSGAILPHEQTMSGPKEDRLRLLERTRANFSPIFTFFSDPERRMDSYREMIKIRPPAIAASNGTGQSHRIWPVNNRELIADLTAYLAERSVLIADGHHRYETALQYSREVNLNLLPGAGYVLATLVGASDSGLLMLPAHRLVYNLENEQVDFMERMIKENFSFLERGRLEDLDQETFLAELNRLAPESGAIGYVTSAGAGLLLPARKLENTDLPVTVLHERLLDPVLAAGNREQEETSLDLEEDHPAGLDFTPDYTKVFEDVAGGKAQAAFLIGFMPVDKVLERARSGMLMPQKSTYFYPKLPGGLVIYHAEKSDVDPALLKSTATI